MSRRQFHEMGCIILAESTCTPALPMQVLQVRAKRTGYRSGAVVGVELLVFDVLALLYRRVAQLTMGEQQSQAGQDAILLSLPDAARRGIEVDGVFTKVTPIIFDQSFADEPADDWGLGAADEILEQYAYQHWRLFFAPVSADDAHDALDFYQDMYLDRPDCPLGEEGHGLTAEMIAQARLVADVLFARRTNNPWREGRHE